MDVADLAPDVEHIVRQVIDSPNETSLVYENCTKGSRTEEADWLLQLCCGVHTDSVIHVLSVMKETAESLGMKPYLACL